MGAYEYQALDAAGKAQRGVLQGDTPKAVRAALRERGLTPLELSEVKEKRSSTSGRAPVFQRAMSGAQLAILTRQFATLVRAGLPLDEVLSALAEQSENESAKRMLVAVRARMMEGSTLASSLAEFPKSFDALYCASVAAGEQSGHLDKVLHRLADYCENSAGFTQKILLALLYPALLALVASAVVIGLLTYVVPQVTQVFSQFDKQLPLMTRLLLALSDLASAYGKGVGIALLLALVGMIFGMRNQAFRLRMHSLLLGVPLIGKMLRGSEAARFARTMAITGAASVPVLEALRISTQVVSFLPMRNALQQVHARVREGISLATALKETGQFPALLVRLVGSGERSGELDQMLEHAADLQERAVQSTLATMVALLEPGMILLMGAVVLSIVLAILQPIFEINTLIGN